MAWHQEKVGLVKESLLEMVQVAKYAVTYKKNDHSKWAANATGGILGLPATVILVPEITGVPIIMFGLDFIYAFVISNPSFIY